MEFGALDLEHWGADGALTLFFLVAARGAERAKTAVLAGSCLSAVLGALLLGHRDRFHVTP